MTPEQRAEHLRELARRRNASYRARHADRLRESNKVRRDATREERRAAGTVYRETHKDVARAYRQRQDKHVVRAYNQAYNEAHRSRLVEQKKAYHQAHREEHKARARAYYEEHKNDFKVYAARHRERILKNSAARKAANRGYYTALQQKREAARKKAMPVWANQAAIEAMYHAARRLSLETGIQYDVDHIVPLKGKNVCGLHVECNLQIITHAENCRKHNTFPYEASA